MERKKYLDNIRWITVVIVMIYHVIYLFNSQGVISNFAIQGIPQLDGFLYLVYPWFMALLFVVSGAAAKSALSKSTKKQFLKNRARKLLTPSIFVMLTLGWTLGRITNYYSDMFQGALVPGFVKYLIYCMSGIGPLWFAQELFVCCLALCLIRQIDKQDRLSKLCAKMKGWGYILLFLSFWGSAQVLNMPVIEVYRTGIYLNSFLMGYYIFSDEKHLSQLQSAKKILCPLAGAGSIAYYSYIRIVIEPQATDNILTSINYCSMSVLKNLYTNLYAWIVILAVFSIAKDVLDFDNAFSRFMTKHSFGYYIFHYLTLAWTAFFCLEILHLPIWVCYFTDLFGMIGLSTILVIMVPRIPFLRWMWLGIKK